MAAALPQFFGAARHPCFEVSGVGPSNVANATEHYAAAGALSHFMLQYLSVINF